MSKVQIRVVSVALAFCLILIGCERTPKGIDCDKAKGMMVPLELIDGSIVRFKSEDEVLFSRTITEILVSDLLTNGSQALIHSPSYTDTVRIQKGVMNSEFVSSTKEILCQLDIKDVQRIYGVCTGIFHGVDNDHPIDFFDFAHQGYSKKSFANDMLVYHGFLSENHALLDGSKDVLEILEVYKNDFNSIYE